MSDILKISTIQEFKNFIYCFRGELTIQLRKIYYKGDLIAIYQPKKPKKMINPKQLKQLVEKTLKAINLYSADATNLILGTIAQESNCGTYIRQINGCALGICQIEPNTFNDIVENYLKYRNPLKIKILVETNTQRLEPESLEYNLSLSIAMCRIHYLRVPEPIPSNIEGYAQYWKQHYNTHLGKGTEEQFIKNYISHIHLQHTH